MDTRRDLLRGFIKIHTFHHASKEAVYGLDMIEELARHGYHLSPGALCPLLHSLEQEGCLVRQNEVVMGGKYEPITGPRPRGRRRCGRLRPYCGNWWRKRSRKEPEPPF